MISIRRVFFTRTGLRFVCDRVWFNCVESDSSLTLSIKHDLIRKPVFPLFGIMLQERMKQVSNSRHFEHSQAIQSFQRGCRELASGLLCGVRSGGPARSYCWIHTSITAVTGT